MNVVLLFVLLVLLSLVLVLVLLVVLVVICVELVLYYLIISLFLRSTRHIRGNCDMIQSNVGSERVTIWEYCGHSM